MEQIEKAHEEINKHLQNALKEIEKAKKIAKSSGIIIKAQLDYNIKIPAQDFSEWESSRECNFENENSPDYSTDDDIPF